MPRYGFGFGFGFLAPVGRGVLDCAGFVLLEEVVGAHDAVFGPVFARRGEWELEGSHFGGLEGGVLWDGCGMGMLRWLVERRGIVREDIWQEWIVQYKDWATCS